MADYLTIFINTFIGTSEWVWRCIFFEVPITENYFWGLTLISALVWVIEIVMPWRKEQAIIRHNFWQDAFYMYFNFFIFSIIIGGVYQVLNRIFNRTGIEADSLTLFDISQWPLLIQLLLFFVLLDFLQWFTHRCLHRFDILWRFHQLHHGTKQMGFAAHLRYHWMENILYKPLKTLGVMLLGGFEPEHAYIVHFISIIIGHLNHANIRLSYGPLKYLFNNPVMHLYHHAYTLPSEHRYGVNFGISLSLWDYLFKTAYVPENSDLKVIQNSPHLFGNSLFGDLNEHKYYSHKIKYGYTYSTNRIYKR